MCCCLARPIVSLCLVLTFLLQRSKIPNNYREPKNQFFPKSQELCYWHASSPLSALSHPPPPSLPPHPSTPPPPRLFNMYIRHIIETSFSWFPSLRMIPRSFLRRRLSRTSRHAELMSPDMDRRSSCLPASSCLNSMACKRCSRLGTLTISSMN